MDEWDDPEADAGPSRLQELLAMVEAGNGMFDDDTLATVPLEGDVALSPLPIPDDATPSRAPLDPIPLPLDATPDAQWSWRPRSATPDPVPTTTTAGAEPAAAVETVYMSPDERPPRQVPAAEAEAEAEPVLSPSLPLASPSPGRGEEATPPRGSQRRSKSASEARDGSTGRYHFCDPSDAAQRFIAKATRRMQAAQRAGVDRLARPTSTASAAARALPRRGVSATRHEYPAPPPWRTPERPPAEGEPTMCVTGHAMELQPSPAAARVAPQRGPTLTLSPRPVNVPPPRKAALPEMDDAALIARWQTPAPTAPSAADLRGAVAAMRRSITLGAAHLTVPRHTTDP